MKVIIVGCGRVGSRLACEMAGEGHEVTIIDRNQTQLDLAAARGALPPDFRGTAVVGDGTDPELLKRAGIEEADVFIAVTEGDNRNIMAAQIAQAIYKVKKVVCRISDPVREEAYRKMGLETYCPTIVGAKTILSMVGGKR